MKEPAVYTLVRHNLWTVNQFPRFFLGIEPIPVGPLAAENIRNHGGVLYPTLEEAWDGAEGFMYPTGDTRIPANPEGRFEEVFFVRQQLFVPEFSGDLIAA